MGMVTKHGQALAVKECASCTMNGRWRQTVRLAAPHPLPHVIRVQVLADLRMALHMLGQPAAHLLLLRELLDPVRTVHMYGCVRLWCCFVAWHFACCPISAWRSRSRVGSQFRTLLPRKMSCLSGFKVRWSHVPLHPKF